MAARRAAPGASPNDFRRPSYLFLKPTTTDSIPVDPSVKLGDDALQTSFQKPAASVLQTDARITSAGLDAYPPEPIQWMAYQHQVHVPGASPLHPVEYRRSDSEDIHIFNRRDIQPSDRHQRQVDDSCQTDGTLTRSTRQSYITNGFFDSLVTIKSPDQFDTLSGNPPYGVHGAFPQFLSTKSFGPLPSSKPKLQTQYELRQTPLAGGPPLQDLYMDGFNLLASSSDDFSHPSPVIPQNTILALAAHERIKHNTDAFQTTQAQRVSTEASSSRGSGQNPPPTAYQLGALQEDVQGLGAYTTNSTGSSIFSTRITPQAENAPRQRHSLSGSAGQRQDQCKSKLLCHICRKSFTLKASLRRHEKEVHRNEGEYCCPPVGLVTKVDGNGVCAVCDHNDPDVNHFMIAHNFEKCYQAFKSGLQRHFKRKDGFLNHLKRHGICAGSLCLNRDVRFAKSKGAHA
ncbi:hypothetical protein MMC26_000774, partial [Xylographa opegraphella]|nr:hypothetical protein [Xylographa opegraphella]